ncbi:hypothetical protein [Photorhabdus heterorhabditis]|uniref:hypothetical protein n=1 Tax=Photorhabdus heterorhabditis TaxID=880156 RepID=UPI000A564651
MTIAQKLTQKAYQEGLQMGRKLAVLKIVCAMINTGIDRETIIKMIVMIQSKLEQIDD